MSAVLQLIVSLALAMQLSTRDSSEYVARHHISNLTLFRGTPQSPRDCCSARSTTSDRTSWSAASGLSGRSPVSHALTS